MDDVAPNDGEVLDDYCFYDHVGGHATFVKLIGGLFEGIREDPELAAMFTDMEGAEQRLLLFFEQYWGGPMTYSLTRGAPKLRMRHMPYKVTPDMTQRWLDRFHDAITDVGFGPEEEFLMRDYVERAARYLINADD